MKTLLRLLCVASLVMGIQSSVFGQTNTDKIVVVKKNGEKVTILTATVELSYVTARTSGYYEGRVVLITDAVVPPEGVELEKKNIELSKIREISWIAVVGGNQKVKLVMTDGQEKEVFLFNNLTGGGRPLSPADIHIKGKALVQGKEYDVTVKCDDVTTVMFVGQKK